jgi:L-seryl-tRNA(Ser) seleniumtransferase
VSVQPAGLAVEELSARLRTHRPAVIGRIVQGRFAMDMRTVAEPEIEEIGAAFRQVLA